MTDELDPNAAPAAVETEPETPAQVQTTEAKPAPTLSIDDALAALDKARKEAAKYRVEKRETKDELTQRIVALENQVIEANRQTIAARYGLPAELAARLRGTTTEELENDAKTLAVFAPKLTPSAPVISATAPVTPARLTHDVIAKMTPEQINAQWEAVSAALPPSSPDSIRPKLIAAKAGLKSRMKRLKEPSWGMPVISFGRMARRFLRWSRSRMIPFGVRRLG